MRFVAGLAVAASVFAITSVAAAQDMSATPTYGSVTLNTGFTPDPHTVSLTAGGSIDASTAPALASASCRGFIASAADYELTYTAGSTFPLKIRVVSDADTTLVVNAPDGSWYCADDVEGFNPVLTWTTPPSGVYDIWVGTYGQTMAPATLQITEL
ncbi:MAG: hypothetical protein KGO50_02560 [Myxococcales bacterium]|jgi:hypothetical protein|nr:hypothetical protein [Myxococcales bacterium]